MTLTDPKRGPGARERGDTPPTARSNAAALLRGADDEALLVRQRMLRGLRRRAGRLSQEHVAGLMELSPKHYWNLEGAGRPWSEDLVQRFESAVGLDPRRDRHIRHVLWQQLLGYPPPPLPAVVTEADRMIVDSQPYPAYISDDAWQIVHANAAMKRLFPGAAAEGSNIMIYVMSEQGRKILIEWERDWVIPMLDQLNACYVAATGANPQLAERLRAVIDTVCQDPDVRRHWDQRAAQFLAGPNGDLRRAVTSSGRTVTLLLWSGLISGPNTRMLQLIPVDRQPDGTLVPIADFDQTPPNTGLNSAAQQ